MKIIPMLICPIDFYKLKLLLIGYRTDKEVGSNDTAHDGFIWSMAWHPLGHILVTGKDC